MMWILYILLCDQKTYYIGITSNLQDRIKSHKAKHNIATKEFSDLEVVYTETYKTRKEVALREIQLKKWSFAKKKALVEGNLARLVKLSRNREVVEGSPERT